MVLRTEQLRFSSSLADLIKVLAWQENIRECFTDSKTICLQGFETGGIASRLLIRPQSLNLALWKTHENCAAVTRLYALYEQALESLTAQYLLELSALNIPYNTLPEGLRKQWRIGIGQILVKWSDGNGLYGSLSENTLVAGFSHATSGSNYNILPDAFLTDPENYRFQRLTRLLSTLGIEDGNEKIAKNPNVENVITNDFGDGMTADSLLNEMINHRNEAAHASPSQIMSFGEIIKYAKLTEAIVDAFCLALMTKLAEFKISAGVFSGHLNIFKCWSKCVSGLEAKTSTNLEVGLQLYSRKNQEFLRILSMESNGVDKNTATLNAGDQIAVKFTDKTTEGSDLYLL